MKRIFTPLLALCAFAAQAQNTLAGTATGLTTGTGPWVLTTDNGNQAGAVWKTNAVDLSKDFHINARLNFGVRQGAEAFTGGADGIAFVMLDKNATRTAVNSSTVGVAGGGMGYVGMDNSLTYEMDTWKNAEANFATAIGPVTFNDPDWGTADHGDFMRNGNPEHTVLANIQNLGELEDGMGHGVLVDWNAAARTLRVRTGSIDVTSTPYASSATEAFVGFTAGTGDARNLQTVELFELDVPPTCTGLTVDASVPALGCRSNTLYIGYGPTSVTATSTPSAGTTYTWYMVGNPTPVATGATFTPTMPGSYYVVAVNGTCTASTEGTPSVITVMDVRCGSGKSGKLDKVYVCHKGGTGGSGHPTVDPFTLCVAPDAVAAHLAHGDCLGMCETMSARSAAPSTTVIYEEEAPAQLEGLVAYPNPSHGQFTLNLKGLSASNVQVVNARGMVVQNVVPGAANSINMDLSRLGAGVYMVRVVSLTSVKTTKVIVQ